MTAKKMSVILLAGGQGTRFGAAKPKQFLELCAKPIALYSYELFCKREDIREIIIVCAPHFRILFNQKSSHIEVKFALPGERRQDSVFQGLQNVDVLSDFVCVHDSARPLITHSLIDRLFSTARENGAAAPGVPIKFTIKECNQDLFVTHTPDRSRWRSHDAWQAPSIPAPGRTLLLRNPAAPETTMTSPPQRQYRRCDRRV